MKPEDYQKAALRTLYPDLTTNERLGLCGLGLTGEIGEVTDLLKKHLYHRNGKPLNIEKLKDELGDVLWYYFVLLDTVGLPFERVAPTIGQGSLLSSDLINKESLEFCGLKLGSRIGVVADLLSSVLYLNVPLAVDKIRDAVGDVLPYLFVLLDTIGLTLEEVMQANATKLETRHANGFNPHYTSDSGASE
jgi:NTP pyrophosphatase (non-canonical NTP hydrolase)